MLLGKADPGGKLPVTFPPDATHFPSYDPNCTDTSATGNCLLYPGVAGPRPFLPGAATSCRTITGMAVNGTSRATAGTTSTTSCRFSVRVRPFLHPVRYSKLNVSPSGDGGIDVSFRIQNTGDVAGSDVPQVYVGPSSQLGVAIRQAVRRLVQFQRVELAPGQFQDLTLHVTPHLLSSWSSAQQQWVVGTGRARSTSGLRRVTCR